MVTLLATIATCDDLEDSGTAAATVKATQKDTTDLQPAASANCRLNYIKRIEYLSNCWII